MTDEQKIGDRRQETGGRGVAALDILKGFGSTRFGVILAAMGLIYMIVGLVLRHGGENTQALTIAERACYLIGILAAIHIVSRTIKKNDGHEKEQTRAEPASGS